MKFFKDTTLVSINNFCEYIRLNHNSRLIIKEKAKLEKNQMEIKVSFNYNVNLLNKIWKQLVFKMQIKIRKRKQLISNYMIKKKENRIGQEVTLKNEDSAIKEIPKNLTIRVTKVQFKIYNFQARNLVKMNRLEEALEYYDSAIQNNTGYMDYFNNIAETLNLQLNDKFLTNEQNRGSCRNLEDADYYSNKANTLNKMNRLEESLENYNLAIQRNPENADYYYKKADTLLTMNRLEEALKYYDSEIQNNPGNSDYLNNIGIMDNFLAYTLDKLNRLKKDLQHFNSAFQNYQINSFSQNRKGIVKQTQLLS